MDTKNTLRRTFCALKDLNASNVVSIKTLLLSIVIGTLVGFVGVSFEIATAWIFSHRSVWVHHWVSHPYAVAAATFALSAVLAGVSYFIVKKYAPEAGGSGIPEIEAAMEDLRPVRWWRVIPMKFLGGMGSLGSGMVLGREGPTVQLGANIGQMMSDISGVKDKETRHTLLSAGSAAGLATAFNAPIAGILFVLEEMRAHFKYNLISVKAVFIGAVMATIACRIVSGQAPILVLGDYAMPAQSQLWLFLVMGLMFGAIGVGFNQLLLWLQQKFLNFYQGKMYRFVLTGALVGGCCGLFGLFLPQIIGGGFDVVKQIAAGQIGWGLLLLVFALRFLTSTISFSSGAAGGIFSPLLALGASFGGIFGYAVDYLFPDTGVQMGSFVVAGMTALFVATVRAPLTGIVLVLEMTTSYNLILPLIITCLGAMLVAQLLGGRPLYTVLMEKILERNGIAYERKE